MKTLLIARYTILEALRRRVLLAIFILSIAYLALFALGFWLLHRAIVEQAARVSPNGGNGLVIFTAGMTLLGFYSLGFLSSLMAVFASAGAISGEVESGLLHAVLAKPIRRRDIVLGKWLGQAVVITIYVCAMTAGMVGASQVAAGYSPPHPILAAAFMTWSALILLALGILGGTFMPTLANGIAVFLLFGLSRGASFIEVVGHLVRSDAMVNLAIAVSLLIPSDALWEAASYYLQPTVLIMAQNLSSGNIMPFASSTPPTTAMLMWSAGYMLVMLVTAIFIFARRDL